MLNDTIRKITPEGAVSTLAGTAGNYGNANGTGSAAQFNYPAALAVDGAGDVYVGELNNYAVRKITPGGVVTTLAERRRHSRLGGWGRDRGTIYGDRRPCPGQCGQPLRGRQRQRHDPEDHRGGGGDDPGGRSGKSGTSDGIGSAALFNGPWGLGLDGAGNLYVAGSATTQPQGGSLGRLR